MIDVSLALNYRSLEPSSNQGEATLPFYCTAGSYYVIYRGTFSGDHLSWLVCMERSTSKSFFSLLFFLSQNREQ